MILILNFPTIVYSSKKDDINLSLINREKDWPQWELPGPFDPSNLKRDIVYPEWFHGAWTVENIDMKDPDFNPIKYKVKFKLNDSEELVGDRSFNALSLGKVILGDKLLLVKDDPKTPNRQFAAFEGQEFLETKIIGRNQYLDGKSVFFVDELALQIYHASDISRIRQVETLSKYQLHKSALKTSENLSGFKILGEQWQAIYPSPGESLKTQPLKTSHYQLIFRKVSLE